MNLKTFFGHEQSVTGGLSENQLAIFAKWLKSDWMPYVSGLNSPLPPYKATYDKETWGLFRKTWTSSLALTYQIGLDTLLVWLSAGSLCYVAYVVYLAVFH